MLPESRQIALERLIGDLCVQIYVIKAWASWRADRATRAEKRRDAEDVRLKHVAIRCIRRKLRKCS